MNSMKFYITTPIYYVNAKPHLGHSYTTIIADVSRRFNDMKGIETYFLTGTDEHGDKVVKAAEKENLKPEKYVDYISGLYQNLWKELNISNNDFVRTTYPYHKKIVEDILNKIHDSGDIYFNEYEGLYCYECERFYTQKELVDGKCPDHKKEPSNIKEANYFFKMSKYQDWLIDHIKKNPDFIRPERYKNEVLSFLKEPLEDLCISRPKTRLTWGINIPFDENYVTYVWFDALINYVSALGYPDGDLFKKFWSSAQHIVAKDILKPHGIFWPIMLKAAGIPIYKHLNVHGYWNVEDSKMSKTIGNVVDPLELKKTYGLDAIRYFLSREMAFGLDSSFSNDAIVARINTDLANDIGNLFSRVFAMIKKMPDKKDAKKDAKREAKKGGWGDFILKDDADKVIENFEKNMESFAFHKALASVWEFIRKLNKYVDEKAPWALAKDKSKKDELNLVMYNLIEGLKIVAALIYPVMPDTSRIMLKHLGFDNLNGFFTFDELKSGAFTALENDFGERIALFPRIVS
jgi:methionyl-tRNA synthetase